MDTAGTNDCRLADLSSPHAVGRYLGKGVLTAVRNINEIIAPALKVCLLFIPCCSTDVAAYSTAASMRGTVSNFNPAPAQGMDPTQQTEIDMKMIDLDGTDNKGKLGACMRNL